MRIRQLLALATAATIVTVALTGCGTRDARDDRDAPSGTELRTIRIDGVDRDYRVHIPSTLADRASLVVMMHGGFGSAAQAESAYGWDALSEREGFIVAYPNGSGVAWNAGSCCGAAAATNVDDVAFISTLVHTLQNEFDIAPARTFATGMSNGALMAYRLACETDLFAAIAPVAGTIVTDCDSPAPTSVLHIHGALDERVRYDGATGSGATRVDGLPVEDAAALWREADGCSPPQVTVATPVTTTTATCPDGRTVTLIVIADAGHQWPGASGTGVADPDAVSTALDATSTIWGFFDEY